MKFLYQYNYHNSNGKWKANFNSIDLKNIIKKVDPNKFTGDEITFLIVMELIILFLCHLLLREIESQDDITISIIDLESLFDCESNYLFTKEELQNKIDELNKGKRLSYIPQKIK